MVTAMSSVVLTRRKVCLTPIVAFRLGQLLPLSFTEPQPGAPPMISLEETLCKLAFLLGANCGEGELKQIHLYNLSYEILG